MLCECVNLRALFLAVHSMLCVCVHARRRRVLGVRRVLAILLGPVRRPCLCSLCRLEPEHRARAVWGGLLLLLRRVHAVRPRPLSTLWRVCGLQGVGEDHRAGRGCGRRRYLCAGGGLVHVLRVRGRLHNRLWAGGEPFRGYFLIPPSCVYL